MSEQVNFSLSPTVLALICVCIVALAVFISWFVRNPFKYPYFTYEFNVSRKRNVVVEDYIDRYISDPNNWEKCKILTVRIGYKVFSPVRCISLL